MKFRAIESIVSGVPYISESNARFLYDLICRKRLTRLIRRLRKTS